MMRDLYHVNERRKRKIEREKKRTVLNGMNISCHRSLDLVTRGREGGTLDTEKKGVYTEGGVMMTK